MTEDKGVPFVSVRLPRKLVAIGATMYATSDFRHRSR